MIILINGATHSGKTLLAQKLLEKSKEIKDYDGIVIDNPLTSCPLIILIDFGK